MNAITAPFRFCEVLSLGLYKLEQFDIIWLREKFMSHFSKAQSKEGRRETPPLYSQPGRCPTVPN